MMKRFFYFIAIIAFFNNCSKEDDTPETIKGGTIKILELVTFKSEDLTKDTYSGKIGNQDVVVYKTDEGELTFKTPARTKIGLNVLSIPTLRNLKIEYNVIDIDIRGSAAENVSSLFTFSNNYIVSIKNTENYEMIDNYFKDLDAFFKKSTEEEQLIMAKFYIANKAKFDYYINSDFSNKSALIDPDIKVLFKYVAAVLSCGVTSALAILDPEPFTKIIAIGVAIITFNKALDLKKQFLSRNVKKLNFVINGIESLLLKSNKKSELNLISGIKSQFSLSSKTRAVISSDTNDSNENISKFFSSNETYNDIIDKINVGIKFVNDKIFFSNIPLLDKSTVRSSSTTNTVVEDNTFLSKANFLVDHSNVQVDEVSFSNNKLNLKVSVIDKTLVSGDFITTTLNYSYTDDFNNLSGSFPLKIKKEGYPINLVANKITKLGQGTFHVNNCYSTVYELDFNYADPDKKIESDLSNIALDVNDRGGFLCIPYSGSMINPSEPLQQKYPIVITNNNNMKIPFAVSFGSNNDYCNLKVYFVDKTTKKRISNDIVFEINRNTNYP